MNVILTSKSIVCITMNDKDNKINCSTYAKISSKTWHINQNSRVNKYENLGPMKPSKYV